VRGDGDHIYVYGRRNTTSNDIVLGRVPKMATLEKSCYQYRTESGWVQLGDGLATELPAIFTGAEQSSDLVVIILTLCTTIDMTQGQVFKTSMFGQESSYRWAFIGCNSFADSKILMGRSEIPEGPVSNSGSLFTCSPTTFSFISYTPIYSIHFPKRK